MTEEKNIDDNIKVENPIGSSAPMTGKRKPLWRRVLKWTAWIVGTLTALLVVAICVVLLYLTPERLTGLVNRYAGDFIDADVHVGRVELTFWSTFPRFNLEVSDLTLVSRSLRSLPPEQRSQLPADADSLLSLDRFSGGIHIVKLINGDIDLYDVELQSPRINLLIVNDSINNFNIIPPSEPSTEPSTVPNISINRFEITGELTARLQVPKDSIDLQLMLAQTSLGGKDAPTYALRFAGATSARLADRRIPLLPFSINGSIDWDLHKPEKVGLRDFRFAVADIPVDFSAQLAIAEQFRIDSLSVDMAKIPVGKIIRYFPSGFDDLIAPVKGLDTDLTMSVEARLKRPYVVGTDSLPSVDARLRAEAGRIRFEDLNLSRFDLDVEADVDGDDLDRSVVKINRLAAKGQASDAEIRGTIKSPISDPDIDMQFRGRIDFGRLPAKLLASLPVTVRGLLEGNARGRFRLSHLSPRQFHRAKIDGLLTLSDFRASMRDGSMDAMVGRGELKLGTSASIALGDRLVDSLLTTSLSIDTAAVNAAGIILTGSRLTANVGMRNTATSSDTTKINPIGATLRAGRLTLTADSGATDMRLRDATLRAVLTRFNGESRSPLLTIDIDADRLGGRTPELAGGVMGARASIVLHPRARKPMTARMQARVDSLAAIYPGLSTDSLMALARQVSRRNADAAATDGTVNIDMKVDNSLASLLRLWQLSGTLQTQRGGVYTHYYPVRTSIRDLDMTFSTDSVVVRNASIRSGKSDFRIYGAIRNIRRAVTSRRNRPIEIQFDVNSSTIDVNDLSATLMRGAASTSPAAAATMDLIAEGNVDVAEILPDAALAETEESGTAAAIIVPSNVKVDLNISADRIHYNDFWFNQFKGQMSVYDGAVSLDQLRASTDMGTINMTALYSAPRPSEIRFAAALGLRRLNLHHLLRQMPHIDSLMPMLRGIEGIVDAQLALTTDLDSAMNIRFNTLDMALRLKGDSLVLLDSETFRTVAKWMMFKNKQRNMIDHMDVEVMVHDGWLDLYPVIFDIDRYRIGVVGNNDLDFNLDYHVAVLKSPIPFKFGINIKGTPEKMKIRLGKSKINEKTAASSRHLTDSLRVNLVREISRSFKRGIMSAGIKGLRMQQIGSGGRQTAGGDESTDQLNAADSAVFIKEGLMPAPEGYVDPLTEPTSSDKDKKKKKKKK